MPVTRRQILLATPTVAGVALLGRSAGAQAPGVQIPTADPMMALIGNELQRAYTELLADRRSPEAWRALEVALSVGTVYAATAIDAEVRRAIARLGTDATVNRALIEHPHVSHGLRAARRPRVLTREDAVAQIEALQKDGVSGLYRRAHRTARGAAERTRRRRERMALPFQPITLQESDDCTKAKEDAEAAAAVTAINCGLAYFFPALMPGCAAMMIISGALGIYAIGVCSSDEYLLL